MGRSAGLAVALALLWPCLVAPAQEAAPVVEEARKVAFLIAIAPVSGTYGEPIDTAAGLAIEDDLTAKFLRAASAHVFVIGPSAFERAAGTVEGVPTPLTSGGARAAARALGVDRVLLVDLKSAESLIDCRWEVYDPGPSGGTVVANRLRGHMVDLDGFITALARKAGAALECFDGETLHNATQSSDTISGDAYTAYYQGLALYAVGDDEGAVAKARQALAKDPDYTAARCLAAAGSAPQAHRMLLRQAWEEALAISQPALLDLRGAVANEGLIEHLHVTYESLVAVGRGPEASQAGLSYAQALVAAGRGDEALRVLSEVTPESSATRVARSRALRLVGDWRAAESVLREGDAEGAPEIQLELATLYQAWGEGVDASTAGGQAEAKRWYGFALTVLKNLCDSEPGSAAYHLRLGLLALAAEDYATCDRALSRALTLDGEGGGVLGPSGRCDTLAGLARAKVAIGQLEAARTLLTTASAEARALSRGAPDPWSGPVATRPPATWLNLCRGWAGLGEMAEAGEWLRVIEAHYGMGSAPPEVKAALAAAAEGPS